MDVAVIILLIVVGGIILWGALTGWTFSGIFGGRGGAERDSPPGPISDVQLEVTTGESGGRRESYRTLDEMAGLSITVSFNTPKSSFGYGDLELKDYVISLGTAAGSNTRDDLRAVIVISRTNQTSGTRLITETNDSILAQGDITLSGDFNATDTRVSITLSDTVWTDGNIILPAGDVFLGIDYTPKEVAGNQYGWNDVTAAKPAGNYTKYFMPGGVSLSGTIQDNGAFVVNPDVTETINEELNIAIGSGNIRGIIDIRKQIGMSSRFLISPARASDKYLRNWLGDEEAIKASIFAEPQEKCTLNRFDSLPTNSTVFTTDFLNGISEDDFLGPESNWFNFAVMEEHIMEEHKSGWVRLGLISNFEKADQAGSKIKWADFPVIHPVHRMKSSDNTLSFHKYDDTSTNAYDYRTYFRFVSPLDSRNNPNSEHFSLCVRRVAKTLTGLDGQLTSEDWFLTYVTWGNLAELKQLKDITDLSYAVFTKRNPSTTPTPSSPSPVVSCINYATLDSCQAAGCRWDTLSGHAGGGGVCVDKSSPSLSPGGGYTFERHVNYNGAILGGTHSVTLPECTALCDANDQCIGFSHAPFASTLGELCILRQGINTSTEHNTEDDDIQYTFYRKP